MVIVIYDEARQVAGRPRDRPILLDTTVSRRRGRGGWRRPSAATDRDRTASPAVRDVDHQPRPGARPGEHEDPERQPRPDTQPYGAVALEAARPGHLAEGAVATDGHQFGRVRRPVRRPVARVVS